MSAATASHHTAPNHAYLTSPIVPRPHRPQPTPAHHATAHRPTNAPTPPHKHVVACQAVQQKLNMAHVGHASSSCTTITDTGTIASCSSLGSEGLVLQRVVGRGGYGMCWKATYQGALVAAKVCVRRGWGRFAACFSLRPSGIMRATHAQIECARASASVLKCARWHCDAGWRRLPPPPTHPGTHTQGYTRSASSRVQVLYPRDLQKEAVKVRKWLMLNPTGSCWT